MTKLQLLHRALNERLMAAVEQIMEMVGGTVQEYEEETIRARKENEILRRRLRWMEGEIHTDWPGLTQPNGFSIPFEIDTSGHEQPVDLPDEPAFESLVIKTEPTDPSDYQSVRPDVSLTASVRTADGETVDLETSEPPDGVLWNMANSYMAPLDFEPAQTGRWKGKGRSQRMSFACPDCGKVFGREQRLMFHMRVHSAESPYTYRRRKACFYGDKKRKRKLRGLSKVYKSREFVEDLSDSSEQTEQSTESPKVNAPQATASSAPEAEPNEESDGASEDTSSSRPPGSSIVKPGIRQQIGKSKWPRCLECKRAFKNATRLALHMKVHRKPFLSQEQQKEQGDTDKTTKRPHQLSKKTKMRNNESEVERARARGRTLFQCSECKKIFARSCWLTLHLKSHKRKRTLSHKEQKRKHLPSNKMQKSGAEVLTEPAKYNAKEKVAEDSGAQTLKKIHACPYCDKVFARAGWLLPHIQSHTDKISRKSDLRRSSFLNSGQEVTEEPEMSQIVFEQPTTGILEPNNTSLDSARDSESNMSCNEFETNLDQSNDFRDESERISEKSTAAVITNSKKTCKECGKVYLNGGWLKTHMKIHEMERMDKETRLIEEKKIHEKRMMCIKRIRQRKMRKELRKTQRRQSLLEKKMMTLKKNEHLEKEHGFDNIEQTVDQDTNEMVSEDFGQQQVTEEPEMGFEQPTREISEPNKTILLATVNSQSKSCNEFETNMDRSIEIRDESKRKHKESTAAVVKKSVTTCQECGKVYLNGGWLKTHMKIHKRQRRDREKRLLEEKRKEEKKMRKEKKRELKLMKELKRKQRMAERQNLVKKKMENLEENELPKKKHGLVEQIRENFEEKGKNVDLELEHSLDDMRQTVNQNTNETLLQENVDQSSDVQAAEAKNKGRKTRSGQYNCKYCSKVYSRRNWLNMHMISHRKTLLASQEEVTNEEQHTENEQIIQQGSSTEDSTEQKEKYGGNESYPCPFCDKVFRRGMRLMVHMQIHSGEKPYPYRQRKEQFYGDPTRPRVPEPDSQEPVIESSDEREEDGFAVTRNQTSAVSQDQTSTTKLMETIQPLSNCTGRKLSQLPLQSAGALSINLQTPDSKPVDNAKKYFNLLPTIVLEPITAESQHWTSPGDDDFRSESELPDTKAVDAVSVNTVEYTEKNNILQLEHSSDIQAVLSGMSCPVLFETDTPDIVLYCTSNNVEDTQTAEGGMSELCQKDILAENPGFSSLDVKQTTVRNELEMIVKDVELEHSSTCSQSCVKSSLTGTVNHVPPLSESEKGSVDLAVIPAVQDYPSNYVQQYVADLASVCTVLSDKSSDAEDEHEWSNTPNNPEEKIKRKGSQKLTGHFVLKGATTNQSSVTSLKQVKKPSCSDPQNTALPSSSHKATDVALDTEFIPNKREEQSVCPLLDRKGHSVGQKSSSTCTVCGLLFSGKASLSQHLRVHSTGTIGKSSSFKMLKMRDKNSETNITQDMVQAQMSEVHKDDSTDICENSDSATALQARTAKSTAGRSEVITGSQTSKRSSETLTKSRQSKQRKVLYCRICSKACRKIERHLKYYHPKEPKVMEAFHFSKTLEQRKKLLSLLCSKHSSDCHDADSLMLNDVVNCLFCQGSYQRNQFWRHALKCEQKKTTDAAPQEATQKTHFPEVAPSNAHKSLKSLVSENVSTEKIPTANPVLDRSKESTQESSYSPLSKNMQPDMEQQSTSGFLSLTQNEACSSNVQKTVDSGSSNTKKNTSQNVSSQLKLRCSKNQSSLELVDHPDFNSQLTTDQKSQRTKSTTNKSGMQKTFGSPTESKQIDKADHDSESTNFLVSDRFSGDIQKTLPEAGNPIETSDSKGHLKEDMTKIGKDTGHNCELSVLDSTIAVKRKQRSRSSEFKETRIKRRRQSNPSQPMRGDEDLLDEDEGALQDMKVYTCQHCSIAFCSPYHLRRHVYTHTGERPYRCSECNLGFTQKYRFRNHQMTHHGGTLVNLDLDLPNKPKTRSESGERPAQSELHEQPLAGSTAAPEPSSPKEKKATSTNKDTVDV